MRTIEIKAEGSCVIAMAWLLRELANDLIKDSEIEEINQNGNRMSEEATLDYFIDGQNE